MANETIDYEKAINSLKTCLDQINTQTVDELISSLESYNKNIWDTPCRKNFSTALTKLKNKYNKLTRDINVSLVELNSKSAAEIINQNAEKVNQVEKKSGGLVNEVNKN